MTSLDIFFYCHNQKDFVHQGLRSIEIQKIPSDVSVRLLCIDDGSTDGSGALLETWGAGFRARNPDKIDWDISFIQRADGFARGQTETFKEGLSWTAADYFAVLEGDDFWLDSSHLTGLMNILENNIWCSASFSSWIAIDEESQLVESRVPPLNHLPGRIVDTLRLAAENPPATLSACMYRGESLRRVRRTLIEFDNLADWGTNLIISTLGPLIWSPSITLGYRVVRSSLWRSVPRKEQLTQMLSLAREYAKQMPVGLGEQVVASVELMANKSYPVKFFRLAKTKGLRTAIFETLKFLLKS